MAGYTKSGVIGRPSLGSKGKGVEVLASLARSFEPLFARLGEQT
jgi:creatinine amidohydrolase